MTRVDDLRSRHEAEAKANLVTVLERNGWSLTATARELGVSPSYVEWMVKHHGLAESYAKSGHPKAGNPHREKSKT